MYAISQSTITIGLLLMVAVSKTLSIKCLNCEGSGQFSKCESSKHPNTTKCPTNYPYCSIETREAYGKLNLIRRRCSNGSVTLTNNPKMRLLNPKTNVSLCVYESALICGRLCDTDLCNGPQNRSPAVGVGSNHLVCSIILSFLFLFDFKRTLPVDTRERKKNH